MSFSVPIDPTGRHLRLRPRLGKVIHRHGLAFRLIRVNHKATGVHENQDALKVIMLANKGKWSETVYLNKGKWCIVIPASFNAPCRETLDAAVDLACTRLMNHSIAEGVHTCERVTAHRAITTYLKDKESD